MTEPTMREIRPVGQESDGSVIWEDVDTGIRWTAGEQPTADEQAEVRAMIVVGPGEEAEAEEAYGLDPRMEDR
jgi:hypothetical protein